MVRIRILWLCVLVNGVADGMVTRQASAPETSRSLLRLAIETRHLARRCGTFVSRIIPNDVESEDVSFDMGVALLAGMRHVRPFQNSKDVILRACSYIDNESPITILVVARQLYFLVSLVEDFGYVSDELYELVKNRLCLYREGLVVTVPRVPFTSEGEMFLWAMHVVDCLDADIRKMESIWQVGR